MTNNEIKHQICEVIKALCDEETKKAYDYAEDEAKHKNYRWADYFEKSACNFMHIEQMAISRVENFFDEVDDEAESNDTPYKEMWEELKKDIERSKSEYEKAEGDQCNAKLYHFATMSKAKKLEDADILSVMDVIEKNRGIE